MSSIAFLQVHAGGAGVSTEDDPLSRLVRTDITIVLPRRRHHEGDAKRVLHEAAMLDATLPEGMTWTNESLLWLHHELARFERCPSSVCRPYLRERRRSPFASGVRSTNEQLAFFDSTCDQYLRTLGLILPTRSRRNLLHAAFLLLLEKGIQNVKESG